VTLQDRKEQLQKQQDMLKEQYIKVAGAIEIIDSMIEDEKNNDAKEKPKK